MPLAHVRKNNARAHCMEGVNIRPETGNAASAADSIESQAMTNLSVGVVKLRVLRSPAKMAERLWLPEVV